MKKLDIATGTNGFKYSVIFNKLGVTILGKENKVQYVKYTDIKELDYHKSFPNYVFTAKTQWNKFPDIGLFDIDEESCKKIMNTFSCYMEEHYSISNHQ